MNGFNISASLIDAIDRCATGDNQSDSCKRVDEAIGASTTDGREPEFEKIAKSVRSIIKDSDVVMVQIAENGKGRKEIGILLKYASKGLINLEKVFVLKNKMKAFDTTLHTGSDGSRNVTMTLKGKISSENVIPFIFKDR